MKKICSFVLALAALNISAFASVPLARGTVVYIRTMSEISSATNESLDAIVDADVKTTDGRVAIKKGTRVNVNLVNQKAKGIGKPGTIEIKSISTTSVDGQTIYLTGSVKEEGENKRFQSLRLGLGLGLAVFPPCLAILAMKGGKAVIPAGTIYTHFSVAEEYLIDM